MKNILSICFVLTFACNLTNAQLLNKGSWMLGGGISAENREFNQAGSPLGLTYDKRSSIAAQPQIGYFIANQIALGVRLYAGTETLRTIGQPVFGQPQFLNTRYNSWGIGGFVKIYQPLGTRFFFDLEIGGSYQTAPNSGISSSLFTNLPTDAKAYEIYANPGISFFFNSKWVLQSYFASLYFVDSEFTRSTLLPDLGSGYGLLFGPQAMVFRLNYFFGKE